jgi:7,8-dihydropterin-6-yl-methyl-4-(beta-D-ribofuranosyl)aminobenzene 5'-phosphate synthase
MVRLEPVDAVEVTLVVDNFVDIFLASAEGARRLPLAYDLYDHQQLVAEHGFSALVTVKSQGRRSSILYDGGMTPRGLGNNLEVIQVDPAGLRAIVISHGHVDHHGGLEGLAARTGRRLPLLIHPGAWRDHKLTFPTGAELHLPPPSRADLEAARAWRWWRSAAPPCWWMAGCCSRARYPGSPGSRSASPSTRRGPAGAGSPTR